MCAALADVFGVAFEMPPWVSQQLLGMREEIEEVQREPEKPKKGSSTSNVSRRKAARRGRRPEGPT